MFTGPIIGSGVGSSGYSGASESEYYGSGNDAEPGLTHCDCGDPVNITTGNLYEELTDLEVPGRGEPLQSRCSCRPREHLMRCWVASRIMARTTLDLDPAVLRELRLLGKREGKSMGRVASELLARALGEDVPPSTSFNWVSHDLGVPRIDLEDKEAVRVVLDGAP